MTFQQLRYFLALCEQRTFTRAAKQCGISQPSLTRAIKELERELGGPLFDRNGRTTCLSRLGTVVQPYFIKAERANADARAAAANYLTTCRTSPRPNTSALPFNVSLQLEEKPMRKAAFSAAAVVTLCLLAIANLQANRPADASPPSASAAADVYTLQSKIDVDALPRYEILSEADE